MGKRGGLWIAGVLVAALAWPAVRVLAQAVYGSIVGTVTDEQGAAVPNAKVTITNIGQGVSFATTTNESGNYEQTHLIPGTYKVHVEVQGFEAYTQEGVVVNADVATQVNANMKLGAVTQTVEVTAAVPVLQTERTDVATTFSERQVEDIPIYNRNFTSFQLLAPGNALLSGWNHASDENPQQSQQILTQGQHFAGTAFMLDGTDNQDPILGIIVINPNLDAINEVKITDQDYDAEFGKAIGAVVTAQTKSGTNQVHGEAFDFERSSNQFAREPFLQCGGDCSGVSSVPKGNWNEFGGSLGGPIKRDKAFIFGDFQGLRNHIGGTGQSRLPSALEESGDLNDLGTPIYDPFETTDATHQTLVLNAQGQPILLPFSQRTQFPNNTIPSSRISPVALNLLKLYPVGTVSATNPLNNDFFAAGTNVLNQNAFDVRPDWYVNDKMHVFGRYSLAKFVRAGSPLYGLALGGPTVSSDPSTGRFAGSSGTNNQSLASGFDYTLSPTLLTDFRLGWFQYSVHDQPGGFGTTPAQSAGAVGLNVDNTYASGMPEFDINGPGSFNFGYGLNINGCNCPLTEIEHQWQFVNNWTDIRGGHTIKFGADVRFAHNLRVPSDSHRAGILAFNNDLTAGPSVSGGAGLADFLLGDVSTFQRYVSSSTNAYETQPRYFFYGQDTWRVNSKLTVNYGLRWEFYVPESAAGPGQGGFLDLGTGEMRVAGQNGVNLQGNTSTSFTHFAPRLGVAYQMNPKTVVRMGYGRSYDMGVFGSVFGHVITQNLPVLAFQNISPSQGDYAFDLADGPPLLNPATLLQSGNCNAITDPTGASAGGATASGFPGSDPKNPNTFTADKTQCVGPNGRPLQPDNVSARARPFDNRLPTIDAWNASVQRQLTASMALTVAYVGNKGTHTFYADNPAVNTNGAFVAGYNPNTPSINGPVLPSDCQNSSMLPYRCRQLYYLKYGWEQGICYFGNDSNNKYNALQVVLDKRFSSGLTFNANYTFQHADYYDAGVGYPYQLLKYGPNSNYRDSVLIFTEVYQLPFGRGKKWGAGMSRAADFVVGGWSVNSATNISSGLPYTIGVSSCGPSSDTGPCFPNISGNVGAGTRSGSPLNVGYWFPAQPHNSVSCAGCTSGPFSQPSLDTFGNEQFNQFRGPGLWNTDLSMFKDFSLTERFKAQFQAQAYNIFNHAILGTNNLSTCVDCGTGGQITDIQFGTQMRAWVFALKFIF